MTLPWDGSGRRRVSCEPAAVKMSCSLVPANCPRTAWTMLLGCWIVSEYMNMFEVVAMFAAGRSQACAAQIACRVWSGEKPLCCVAAFSRSCRELAPAPKVW